MKIFLLLFCIMEGPILAYWLYVALKGQPGMSVMDRFRMNADVWSFIALGVVTIFIAVLALSLTFGLILLQFLSS